MIPVGKAGKAVADAAGEVASEGAAAAKRAAAPVAVEPAAAASTHVADLLEAAGARAREAPAPRFLPIEEVQPWVGVPDVVVRLLDHSGRVRLAAGEIESVSIMRSAPSYEAMIIDFKHLDPELLRGKLHGTEEPHIASKRLHITLGRDDGVLSIGRASDAAVSETRPQRMRLRGRAAEITEQLDRGEYTPPFNLAEPGPYASAGNGQGIRGRYEFPPEMKDALMKEQNALFSVILEKVAPRVEREAPDSAAIDALFRASEWESGPQDAFTRLSDRTSSSLSSAVFDLHRAESADRGYLEPALKAADEIIKFRANYDLGRRFSGTLDAITTGITTLKLNSANLARAVPEVWALRKPGVPADAAQLATIYRNSRRLLDQMASSDIGLHVIDDLQRSFGTVDEGIKLGWEPSFFELVGEGEHQMLGISDDFIRAFKAEHGAWMNMPLASATGCPALTAGILSSFSRRMEPGLQALYERLLPEVMGGVVP